MRGRRRKYRVGAKTVNFTSAGLVASAVVVVMEVTAPSGVPPGVFASPARVSGPSSPTLPFRFAAPAAARAPVSPLGIGGSSTAAASGEARGVTTATALSHAVSSANTGVAPTTVPPVALHSNALAAPAARGENGAGSGSGNGSANGSGSGNGSESGRAGAAAADATPYASATATTRSDGNGNARQRNERRQRERPTTVRAPTVTVTASRSRARDRRRCRAPSVRPSRSAPRTPRGEARRPAPQPGTRRAPVSDDGRSPTAGHGWGGGQDDHAGDPPGRPSTSGR